MFVGSSQCHPVNTEEESREMTETERNEVQPSGYGSGVSEQEV